MDKPSWSSSSSSGSRQLWYVTTNSIISWITKIKFSGSCWAFAAIASLEGQLSLLKGRNDLLSVQEVLECGRNPYVTNGALLGCNGGWQLAAWNHFKNNNGVTYAATRPYNGATLSSCVTTTARVPGTKTVGYYKLPSNEEDMKYYLYNFGPLYVTYHVSNDFYSYKSGVFTDAKNQCAGKPINQ